MAGEMRAVDQLSDAELEAEIQRLKAGRPLDPLPAGKSQIPNGRPVNSDVESSQFYGNPESETKAAVAGLKRTGQRIVNGGAQGFLEGRKLVTDDPANDIALTDLAAEERSNKRATDPIARKHPFGYGLGESLPTLPMGGGFLSSLAKGGLFGATKYGNTQERVANAVVDGGATAIGNTVGRAAGGFLNPNLSRVERETLREGRARGISPRLSQVTRSPTIERFEDWSGRMPVGAGVMDEFNQTNTRGFNRAAAESMGQQPDAAGQVGPEVFARAKRDTKVPFKDVDALPNPGGIPPIEVGPNVAAAAQNVLHRQTLRLTPDTVLSDISHQALHAAQNGGRMTGEAYNALRSELSDKMWEATGKAREDYRILLDAIDEAADTSLRNMHRPDLADNLLMARDQYGNYKTLTQGRVAEGGNVTPARTAQAVRANNPDAFRTGRTDGTPLGFLARWGELFPPLRAGSQTAERQATGEMVRHPGELESMVGAAASPVIAKATTSPIVTGIPARIGGTPVGRAAEFVAEPTVAGTVQSLLRRIMRPQTP